MTRIDLQLSVEQSGSPFTVVTATGELDGVTAPLLRAKLADVMGSGMFNVALDLSGVGFIDSTGLGVLAYYHKRFVSAGGKMRVVVTHPSLRKLFVMTGLNHALFVYEALDDALAV